MITVGIPVFNEAMYLEETLETILKQIEHVDKIIITDNASTDCTQEICLRYADQCNKIKYIRHESQVSVFENFKFSLNHAETEYFMWLAGHDLLSSNYMETMKRLLDENQDAIIAVPNVYQFYHDLLGKKLTIDFSKGNFSSDSVIDRVNSVLENWRSYSVVNQLWRRNPLKEFMGICSKTWTQFDVIMPMYGVLKGKFVFNNDASYYYRINRPEESLNARDERYETMFQINIPNINPRKYLAIISWELICRHDAKLKQCEELKRKLIYNYRTFYDADFNDNVWCARNTEKLEEYLDQEKINSILGKDDKSYVIFGVGMEGRRLYRAIKSSVTIKYFIDNSIEMQEFQLNGLDIKSPNYLKSYEDLVDENNKDIFIIIGSTRYGSDMVNQLEKLGFMYGKNMISYDEFIFDEENSVDHEG